MYLFIITTIIWGFETNLLLTYPTCLLTHHRLRGSASTVLTAIAGG